MNSIRKEIIALTILLAIFFLPLLVYDLFFSIKHHSVAVKTVWYVKRPKGPVKCLTEYVYDLYKGKWDSGYILYTTYRYNDRGSLTEKQEEMADAFSKRINPLVWYRYNYDDEQRLISSTSCYSEDLLTLYRYDGSGRQILTESCDLRSGKTDLCERHSIGLFGNIRMDTLYNKHDTIGQITTYNEQKRPTMVEPNEYDHPLAPFNQVFIIDNNSDLVEWTAYRDDSLHPCYHITAGYDTHGDLSKEIDQNLNEPSENCVITYTYTEYDTAGNWLTRRSFEDGVPSHLTVRKIQYY